MCRMGQYLYMASASLVLFPTCRCDGMMVLDVAMMMLFILDVDFFKP